MDDRIELKPPSCKVSVHSDVLARFFSIIALYNYIYDA